MNTHEWAREHGIFWRDHKTTFQKIVRVVFGNYQWARRLLGGRWELLVHDKGTLHTVLMWHWVDKWSTNKGFYKESIIAQEFYRHGLKQSFDFGDDWYAKQPKPLGDKDGVTFDPRLAPKDFDTNDKGPTQ